MNKKINTHENRKKYWGYYIYPFCYKILLYKRLEVSDLEDILTTDNNTDMKTRVIALVDCDSFFVSCEQADKPEYKNTPTCVISGPNGCVISRSKEAKKVGVKMGMPMFMAKKEFPNVNYICADHTKYHEYSKRVMACLKDYSPDIEVVSVDEAYIYNT